MTELKPDLGRYGVWIFGAPTPEQAAEIERLGYGAVWIGGSPAADLSYVEPILEATERLQVATGILNVWTAPAEEVADAYHRVEKAFPGRFLLGIGIGHPEHTEEYRKPYDVLVEYLDALDAKKVPTSRRVLAALGPRVLKLAAQRSAGAHPYLTTPQHTGEARNLLGPTVFLAPEHKVVLARDAAASREIGRQTVDFYLGLSNYLNNWKRLGFTDEDLARPGSDRFIDAVVAHGTPESIAARLNEHLEAGADHVAIQVLGGEDVLIPTLTDLAGPLGLTG
ncbi:putative F420-dependent oxidoreductase, MSMEG_4141 family [Mycolicibacterium phlei]|jgi:probable F420-dependent oxidoreductase|uniref:F420-dependent oxidoreductase n=1 Tax=Mycolicibacterium phlei DSM 43239 = CCUG 21000 TaxID=1226750 RepID=A0A5N5UTR1_MYCPH|nr:LLM class F420-dependent oxidoreductase [Mycolicibacterium phlei]VEG08315.1 putative F420-dependent oxidoreductase, MSMEG_4141 family [Mycobacteroides chelonae]AMO60195.1 Luciferase-like monooxygenase [Mycolicibacterium phlei]EID16894.1 putative F420-dependent oxidoreductase, MSMEG_4141 family protein [Mycolicibacterium phlei RIVM601174]KAB7751889.1 F420-dependent oxidoreductase [Mycolicibacterium phlei DSM 43239 = CCUG 21000]KXW60477.1 F420-dependent oxidoreductase [Mycolicibacterium phlei